MMPFCISTLMTSTERRAMRLASSETAMVSGNRDFARAGGTGRLGLRALHALQMAAVSGDRTHALVIIRKRACNGKLAAAAIFRRFARGRRVFGRGLAAGAFLGVRFFFFVHGRFAAMGFSQ